MNTASLPDRREPRAASSAPHRAATLIWLVIGDKLGDNAQARRIADCLGLPYQVRYLRPLPAFEHGKPRFRASLHHLDLARSDTLAPPWPDLVITIGRRHSMAALWIRQQSPATRLVLVGRPRRWIERFDLVITLPQYSLPELPNVMRLSLPLMRTDRTAVEAAGREWQSRLGALPRPLTAVLVGGATRPFRFDTNTAHALLEYCAGLQAHDGGTLYFSTSRRTSPAIVATLRQQLPAGARLFEWQADSQDNPYHGLLALADRFVVTGDSVSMMVEVADCARPLAIFPLPSPWHSRLWQRLTRKLHSPPGSGHGQAPWRWLGRMLYRSGSLGFSRDLTQVHAALIHRGYAALAGDGFNQPPPRGLPDEGPAIRERVLALLATRQGGDATGR